jgi:C4-type Zn-finger protein
VVVVQPCRVKAAGVNNIQDSCRHMNSYLYHSSYNKQLSMSNSCCSRCRYRISKVDVLTLTLGKSARENYSANCRLA